MEGYAAARQSRMKRVYVYCRDRRDAYQDDIVVLAEGLRELDVEVFGSCNYWQQSLDPDDWLVRHDPTVDAADCDVVVVSSAWARWLDHDFRVVGDPLPEGLFSPGRRYRTAFIDVDDGYLTSSFRPEFRSFDAVFRAKYNRRCFHPENHHPWALGLTQRVLHGVQNTLPWSERRQEVLVNFNASHPYLHPARVQMEAGFVAAAQPRWSINRTRDDLKRPPDDPWDRLMWEQTQHRHARAYYKRLGAARGVAAFCGELVPPAPYAPPYLVGGGRARWLRRVFDALAVVDWRPPRLIQWDSWRFWEALAAGCLVFNLDLEHYGVDLPVMPRNYVHYIGLRPDNVREAFARLKREPDLAERVAAQGRVWAIEHYSPRALAQRFLQTVS